MTKSSLKLHILSKDFILLYSNVESFSLYKTKNKHMFKKNFSQNKFLNIYDLETAYIRSDHIEYVTPKSKCLHISVKKGLQGNENKALNYKRK